MKITEKLNLLFFNLVFIRMTNSCRQENGTNIVRVTCSNISFIDDIPPIQSRANYAYSLKIIESKITILPTSGFIKYTNSTGQFSNLTILHLEHLHIKVIMPGAFNGLNLLEQLYLDNNELTIVTRGIYNSLSRLKILNLSHNRIRKIEKYALNGADDLTSLYLGHNNMSKIEDDFLKHQKMVTALDLTANPLKELRITCSLNVSYLDVTECQLKTITFDSCATHNFTEIMLNNNQIKKIKGNITALTFLWMPHNNLKTLENFFNKSKQLDFINLGYNKIETIQKDALQGLHSLSSLNLEHNKIRKVEVSMFLDLQNLKYLDLSYNEISELPYGVFNKLAQLTSLYISYNKLAQLDDTLYRSLHNLNFFYFQHNQISSLDAAAMVNHLKKLQAVGINNNAWQCKDLSGIVDVFIKQNVILSGAESFDVENVEGIACSSSSKRVTTGGVKPRMYLDKGDDLEKNFNVNIVYLLKNCSSRCLLLVRW